MFRLGVRVRGRGGLVGTPGCNEAGSVQDRCIEALTGPIPHATDQSGDWVGADAQRRRSL